MKKGTLMFLIGTLLGAGATYVATTKKEEILKKIDEIQNQLKESDLPERAKNLAREIADNIKVLVSSSEEGLGDEKKKEILEDVENKIQKLEQAINVSQ